MAWGAWLGGYLASDASTVVGAKGELSHPAVHASVKVAMHLISYILYAQTCLHHQVFTKPNLTLLSLHSQGVTTQHGLGQASALPPRQRCRCSHAHSKSIFYEATKVATEGHGTWHADCIFSHLGVVAGLPPVKARFQGTTATFKTCSFQVEPPQAWIYSTSPVLTLRTSCCPCEELHCSCLEGFLGQLKWGLEVFLTVVKVWRVAAGQC